MLSSQGRTQYHGGNKPIHTAFKALQNPAHNSKKCFRTSICRRQHVKNALKSYIYRSVDASSAADNKQIHHMQTENKQELSVLATISSYQPGIQMHQSYNQVAPFFSETKGLQSNTVPQIHISTSRSLD